MSNSDSQQFILDFFNKIDNILEKKGGKRKLHKTYKKIYKKQRGSGNGDEELNLPVPLDSNTQSVLNELSQTIQSDESLKSTVKIVVTPSENIPDDKLNDEFRNHLQMLSTNILTKSTINMSPEELQMLSLFVSYKNMKSDITNASNIVTKTLTSISQMSQTDKVVIEDDKSDENITLVSTLLEKITGASDLVDKQVQAMETILTSSIGDTIRLANLYDTYASPEEISSASLSAFTNSFGYLSFLFNLLLCYKNRISDYSSNLKNTNPVLYLIISSIYSAISFILFMMFKLFMFLINTKIGQIYILIIFIKLYKDNNAVAVFISNVILKLLRMADLQIGASNYVNNCIDQAKQALMNSLPLLLTNAGILSLFKNSIQSALLDPTIVANFIQTLTPELSAQIIQQSLPMLSQGLSDSITSATPQMINALTYSVTQTITSATPQMIEAITAELAPALIEGISSNVGSLITDTASTIVAQTATQMTTQLANQQITSSLVNSVSKYALGYAVKAGVYFLTGDTSSGDVLQQAITNTGGKRTNKIRKGKNENGKNGNGKNKKSKNRKICKRNSKTYKK